MPKRRVLLVDDEVAVLLTMKAVLEISGFDVDTATSAQEGRSKIRTHEYQMVITDMRMESDAAGREVIQAARTAPYHPAVALLTAYPVDDAEWQDMGADRMLVKPMQTPMLIRQLERLLASHAANLGKISAAATKQNGAATQAAATKPVVKPVVKPAAKKTVSKQVVAKRSGATKAAAEKASAKKAVAKKSGTKKSGTKKAAAKKTKRR